MDDELVLIVLVRTTDADSRVLEDELRIALGGKRSDEVELALGQFAESFLGGRAEDQLADFGGGIRVSRLIDTELMVVRKWRGEMLKLFKLVIGAKYIHLDNVYIKINPTTAPALSSTHG